MTQFHLASSGTAVVLGQEIGRGGEGTVFALQNAPNRVAKLYAREPDGTKIKKLTTMVAMNSPALLRIAAWPIDLLMDSHNTVCGFVMPHVAARRDIHELYSPKSRSDAFPETDFRFLVHVGVNIARAFAVIQTHGHVIGDVNHGSVLVGTDGTVMLIDCDSFQVGYGANLFPCDVGVPLFTAPELHGRPLRGLVRTSNHDLFGLAVLLFHLLYMGRHPFAGRFLGQGDMPIEKAVAQYRFAYGPDRAVNAMERPPGTIALETMGSTVRDLFIRAFEQAGSHGGRPVAEKWIDALVQLESSLRVCGRANWHHYRNELSDCPWCVIEKQIGVRLFGQRVFTAPGIGAVDVAALWQAIVTVPAPGPDPVLPSERPEQASPWSMNPKAIGKVVRKVIGLALIVGGLVASNSNPKQGGLLWAVLACVAAYVIWPRISSEKKAQAQQGHQNAKGQWDNILSRWKAEASESIFREKFHELENARTQLADLPKKRQQGLARLEAEREQRQLHRYLDRFRIDRADIPGIGPSRKIMLASYGIETAADVERKAIDHIPGFGHKLTGELVNWRKSHEQKFRFNPSERINIKDIESLDRDLETRGVHLTGILREGPDHLRRLTAEIANGRMRLMPIVERCWNEFSVAEASLKSL